MRVNSVALFFRIFNLFVGTVFLVASCQPAPPSRTKIVGGDVVTDLKDITMRSTVSLKANGALCTGTIIGPNQVITAAHCMHGTAGLTIGFGPSGSRIPGIKVIGARAHPSWSDGNSDRTHDIGMVIFEGTLPENLGPVSISPLTGIADGVATILAGYGHTSKAKNGAGTLRRVTAKIKRFIQEDKEFSMQEGLGVGACYGDSGGPAYIESAGSLTVIGATSRGSNCDSGDGIYSDVRQYQGWFKCTAKEFGKPLGYLLNDASNAACKPEYIDTVVDSNGTPPIIDNTGTAQDVKIMIGDAGSEPGVSTLYFAANADSGNLRQVSFCVGNKAACEGSSAIWIQATKNNAVGGRVLFSSPQALKITDGMILTVKSEAASEENIEQFAFTKV